MTSRSQDPNSKRFAHTHCALTTSCQQLCGGKCVERSSVRPSGVAHARRGRGIATRPAGGRICVSACGRMPFERRFCKRRNERFAPETLRSMCAVCTLLPDLDIMLYLASVVAGYVLDLSDDMGGVELTPPSWGGSSAGGIGSDISKLSGYSPSQAVGEAGTNHPCPRPGPLSMSVSNKPSCVPAGEPEVLVPIESAPGGVIRPEGNIPGLGHA